MKSMVLAAVLCASVTVAADDKKLGTGVSLKEATPIAALVEKPQEFVGKTVRVDGVATAVCEAMGCWMAIAPEGDANGATVRLKVEHGESIVFPVSAKGKKVSAEGIFEQASDAEAKEAAGEHAKHDAKASKTYHIKATGALIK